MVREYNEFRLCREMGLTPRELEEIDGETVQRWLIYLSAEAIARERLAERARRKGGE
ncbi:hypothetical protein [Alicyclobacillus sendaiensis]|uniref:hypothetical protein n=1 Tax=Alicyclobacillus sendaiensis TaxID=192387 RepID=UPI0002D422D2|nr:hypothetical protein [Alicyclobacillus sendaiensis]